MLPQVELSKACNSKLLKRYSSCNRKVKGFLVTGGYGQLCDMSEFKVRQETFVLLGSHHF